ncbi:MAG: hypothetical protein M3Z04_14625 [Chloroflexota bacterium]|nr:hypothetical protein [Chloroflexota bacterium]
MSRRHYVLDCAPGDKFGAQLVQGALERLEEHDLYLGFPFQEVLDAQLLHYGWVDQDQRAVITLVDDFRTPVRYLIIEALTRHEVEQIGTWLGEYLEFIPLVVLEQQAREQPARDPATLIRLASGGPEEYTATTYEILQAGLQHPDPAVQYAAAFAAGLLQWPQFAPDLAALLHTQPNATLGTVAARALESCRRRAP